MALTDTYARVADLQQLVATLSVQAPTADTTAAAADTAAPATSFQQQLASAVTSTPTAQPLPLAAAPTTATPTAAPVPTATAGHVDSCCCACCCGGGGSIEAPTATAAPAVTPTSLPLTAPAGSDPTGAVGQRALSIAETQVGQAEQPPGSNDGPALVDYRSAVAGAAPGEPWCAYFVSWAAMEAGLPLGDQGQGLGSVAAITDWAQRTGRLLPPGAPPQAGDLILFGDRHIGMVESVNLDGSLTTVEGNYRNQVSRVQRSPAEATGFVRL